MKIHFKEYQIVFKAEVINSKDFASVTLDWKSRTVNVVTKTNLLYIFPIETIRLIEDTFPAEMEPSQSTPVAPLSLPTQPAPQESKQKGKRS
jgi:hypothetical protein